MAFVRGLIGACWIVGAVGCRQILGFDDPAVVKDAEQPADAAAADTDDDGWRSGTRLKLMWNDYEGSREYTGLYDSQLASKCEAQLWIDGRYYCIPTHGTSLAFLDADCTQPIGITNNNPDGCRPPPNFFAMVEATACAGLQRSRLVRRGERLTPPALIYRLTNGVCTGVAPSSLNDHYAFGEELGLEDLVELVPSVVEMGRFQRRDFAGTDGSRRPREIYDTTLDSVCTLDAENRCVPKVGSGGAFADDACTQSLSAWLRACPVDGYGTRDRRPGCADPGTEYYTLGEPETRAALWRLSSGTCTTLTPSPDYDYYQLESQVTPASLARTIDAGPGPQIRAVHYTDGMASLRGRMYDATLGVECTGNTNVERCLPTSPAGIVTHFTDDECSVPREFASVFSGPAACGTPRMPAFAMKAVATDDPCKPSYEVYRLGNRYTGALFTSTSSGCSPNTITNMIFFELGAQEPLTAFGRYSQLVEP